MTTADPDQGDVVVYLKGVFDSGELKRSATVAESATVQREGNRKVTRQVEYFNLDAILSVGYRVNSKRGTQFRIWATQTLREHLLRGYTFNERRLREKGLGELEQAVGLLAKTLTQHALATPLVEPELDRLARIQALLVEAPRPAGPRAPSSASLCSRTADSRVDPR